MEIPNECKKCKGICGVYPKLITLRWMQLPKVGIIYLNEIADTLKMDECEFKKLVPELEKYGLLVETTDHGTICYLKMKEAYCPESFFIFKRENPEEYNELKRRNPKYPFPC